MTMNRLLLAALPLAVATSLFCPPVTVLAADLRIVSDTLVRVFERDTTEGDDRTVVPGYEYLQVDYGSRQEKGLSFHLYGWGRLDFGSSGFFADDNAGELLYGYFAYAHPGTNAGARLGRFYVFEGVANEAVDGLSLKSDLTRFFTLSAYGGFPVALDSTDGRSSDSIFGGRLSHHLAAWYDVGVSYKNTENDGDTAEEVLGVDLSLNLPYGISFFGFSSRNLDTEGWGEHSHELRIPVAGLLLRPYYQKFQFEDFFGTGVLARNPFPFEAATGETLEVFGSDVTWPVATAWELGVKVKYLDYDIRSGNSELFSALATWHGQKLTQVGGEIGYANGTGGTNDYWLGRLFVYWDQLQQKFPHGFVTGDLVYADYNEDIFGESDALFASLGAGRRFLEDALEIKLSGDYSSGPFFDEDFRGILVARYVFDR
jgi:hypothetical protein